ncbi:hypothetical protein ACFWBS_38350 [Streptomyces mirabilis]|uniref:hypothetical protein n=1 Tax=Streptomyces TaxID=1883 RepID=UPI000BDC8559|nr:hypothetical protein [Streptomyces sp. OK228]SOE24806.1 hypothetical protein SAMN05442782_1459 [Streptomyces sp. OK228]
MPKTPAGRIVYWSQRLVEEVIDSNGIRVDPRLKSVVKVGAGGAGVELSGHERNKVTRFEIMKKVSKKLGNELVSDLDTPGPLHFLQGQGRADVTEFQRWGPVTDHSFRQETCLVHVRTISRRGRRVDLCLFGSLGNLTGYTAPEGQVTGWTSSAAPAIEELVATRGARFPRFYDDESVAVEALKVALYQGAHADLSDHPGRPETRAYTIAGIESCQYAAVVYKDVTLTPGRWDFRHEPEMNGAERILVGAPLWLRAIGS